MMQHFSPLEQQEDVSGIADELSATHFATLLSLRHDDVQETGQKV